jgi:hypothetical protein
MKDNKWLRLLTYVTGPGQPRIAPAKTNTWQRRTGFCAPIRLCLSDAERSTLAEIAKRLGRKALAEGARVGKAGDHLGPGTEG